MEHDLSAVALKERLSQKVSRVLFRWKQISVVKLVSHLRRLFFDGRYSLKLVCLPGTGHGEYYNIGGMYSCTIGDMLNYLISHSASVVRLGIRIASRRYGLTQQVFEP